MSHPDAELVTKLALTCLGRVPNSAPVCISRKVNHCIRRACVFGFGMLQLGPALVAAETTISLGGVWVLEAVAQDGRESRDLRWSCLVTFEGDATFSLASTAVTEKWLDGLGGPTAQPVQQDVRFVGTYRVDGDQLVVTLPQPATPEQREFIATNLGALDESGTFRTRLSWEGQLVLTNETNGRRLLFVRHTRPVKP